MRLLLHESLPGFTCDPIPFISTPDRPSISSHNDPLQNSSRPPFAHCLLFRPIEQLTLHFVILGLGPLPTDDLTLSSSPSCLNDFPSQLSSTSPRPQSQRCLASIGVKRSDAHWAQPTCHQSHPEKAKATPSSPPEVSKPVQVPPVLF